MSQASAAEIGIDHAQSAMHASNGLRQLGGRAIFQQVSPCAGIHGAAQITRAGEGGQDHHACLRISLLHFGGESEPGHFRHLNIGHQHIGFLLGD